MFLVLIEREGAYSSLSQKYSHDVYMTRSRSVYANIGDELLCTAHTTTCLHDNTVHALLFLWLLRCCRLCCSCMSSAHTTVPLRRCPRLLAVKHPTPHKHTKYQVRRSARCASARRCRQQRGRVRCGRDRIGRFATVSDRCDHAVCH